MKKNKSAYKNNIHYTLKSVCGDSGSLLFGLTGGIATGKSTVSEIFRKLGATIIDFDLLARSVVEPGRKSWKLIVEHFGGQVLKEDSSINRKKLSDIVFNDHQEKEKLESFTHPYIWDEFILKVKEVIQKDGNSIILAVVPLLIEGNMQDLFRKIIVVHAPPNLQIERLIKRDKISREKAENILASQMPIDEKIQYGDFVINNDSLIDATKEQTKVLWRKLKKIRFEN
jgi:dephospho-CoA kinase